MSLISELEAARRRHPSAMPVDYRRQAEEELDAALAALAQARARLERAQDALARAQEMIP